MIVLDRDNRLTAAQRALMDFIAMYNFFVNAMNDVEAAAEDLGITEDQLWAIKQKAERITEETYALRAMLTFRENANG